LLKNVGQTQINDENIVVGAVVPIGPPMLKFGDVATLAAVTRPGP
jgi:hypothetical protein